MPNFIENLEKETQKIKILQKREDNQTKNIQEFQEAIIKNGVGGEKEKNNNENLK